MAQRHRQWLNTINNGQCHRQWLNTITNGQSLNAIAHRQSPIINGGAYRARQPSAANASFASLSKAPPIVRYFR